MHACRHSCNHLPGCSGGKPHISAVPRRNDSPLAVAGPGKPAHSSREDQRAFRLCAQEGYDVDDQGNCIQQQTTDVCPNIDGDQASVPEGYVVDDDGACVPRQDPPPDVCPNIDGAQESVPTGYRMIDGVCVELEDADACPNIPGSQDQAPDGMVFDANGDCVTPPADVDVCPNLQGTQTTIPTGSTQDASGNCVVTAGATDTPAGGDNGTAAGEGSTPTASATAGESSGPSVNADSRDRPRAGHETVVRGELPYTGATTWVLALIGGLLLATGAWLELGVRREHRA